MAQVVSTEAELVCSLPAEERSIPLADIGARTQLDVDGVEFLLMKALSLNLIHGSIDQVDQRVQAGPPQPILSCVRHLDACLAVLVTQFDAVQQLLDCSPEPSAESCACRCRGCSREC